MMVLPGTSHVFFKAKAESQSFFSQMCCMRLAPEQNMYVAGVFYSHNNEIDRAEIANPFLASQTNHLCKHAAYGINMRTGVFSIARENCKKKLISYK